MYNLKKYFCPDYLSSYEKNNVVDVSKNLVRYRSENNFVELQNNYV